MLKGYESDSNGLNGRSCQTFSIEPRMIYRDKKKTVIISCRVYKSTDNCNSVNIYDGIVKSNFSTILV